MDKVRNTDRNLMCRFGGLYLANLFLDRQPFVKLIQDAYRFEGILAPSKRRRSSCFQLRRKKVGETAKYTDKMSVRHILIVISGIMITFGCSALVFSTWSAFQAVVPEQLGVDTATWAALHHRSVSC